MQKKRVPGKKNQNGQDYIALVKTNGFEALTIEDILWIIDSIISNDARIYPRAKGYKSVDVFASQLLRVITKHLEGR